MGSSIRRARKHGCVRTHRDSIDCCEGSWCFRHNARWREGCARHTVSTEGGAKGPGIPGYSFEATGFGDGGGECGAGSCESADELCEWRDDPGYWWTGNVDGLVNEVIARNNTISPFCSRSVYQCQYSNECCLKVVPKVFIVSSSKPETRASWLGSVPPPPLSPDTTTARVPASRNRIPSLHFPSFCMS